MQSAYERQLWQKRSTIRRHFAQYDAAQINKEEFDALLQNDGIKLTQQYHKVMRSLAGYIKFGELIGALSKQDDEAVARASEGRSESADAPSQVLSQILHWKQSIPGMEIPTPTSQHTLSFPYGKQRKPSEIIIRTVHDALRAYEKGLLNIRELRKMITDDFQVDLTNSQETILNRCARVSTVTLQELWMAFSGAHGNPDIGNFTRQEQLSARRASIPSHDNHLDVHNWHSVADNPATPTPPVTVTMSGEPQEDYVSSNRGVGDILSWRNTAEHVCQLNKPRPSRGLVDCNEAHELYNHHFHVDTAARTVMADKHNYNRRRTFVKRFDNEKGHKRIYGGDLNMLHWDDTKRPGPEAVPGQPTTSSVGSPPRVFNFEGQSGHGSGLLSNAVQAPFENGNYPRLPTPYGTAKDVSQGSRGSLSPPNPLSERYRRLALQSVQI